MRDTGRISTTINPIAGRIVFGNTVDHLIDELPLYAQIDKAHLVMLAEQQLIPATKVRAALKAIAELEHNQFDVFRGKHSPRGLYLLYEDCLIQRLGAEIGGSIHLGRSRNDLNATILRLRLRKPYRVIVLEVLRLILLLNRRSLGYSAISMPLYTHYQAALPSSLGHYLCGIALALLRDLKGIEDATAPEWCPLGAGAGGGTTIPINAKRSAELLGFDCEVLNSIDAIASRDFVLRLLSSIAILGITLSRLAADLLLWTTEEFGFVWLPDDLVGSSSMLPQKRNPFLLEHIKGKCAACTGALMTSLSAMHGVPYTNSVSVGTEGVKGLWNALNEASEAVTLTRLLVAGCQPRTKTMLNRATTGFTAATDVANRLVQDGGMSFRQAHMTVGQLVNEAIERGETLSVASERAFSALGLTFDKESIRPEHLIARMRFGGGPAPESIDKMRRYISEQWCLSLKEMNKRVKRWREGRRLSDQCIASIVGSG